MCHTGAVDKPILPGNFICNLVLLCASLFMKIFYFIKTLSLNRWNLKDQSKNNWKTTKNILKKQIYAQSP